MNTLLGIIKNGEIILDSPPLLPDGTRVEVVPVEVVPKSMGMSEENWPTTPEGIAALLATMDQVEQGWLSPEDEVTWRAALYSQKEREKAEFLKDAENIRRIWE